MQLWLTVLGPKFWILAARSDNTSSLPSRSLRTPALHSWPNTCRCGQHAGVSSSNRFSRFSSSILQGRGYQCSPLSLRASTSDDEGGTLTKPRPKGLTTVEDEGFNFQSFLKSELPGKLAILLSLVVVSRLGVYVRLPGVDVDGFSAMMQNMHAAADIRVIQLSLKVLKLQDAQWLDRIAMSNCVQMLLHTWQKGHKVLLYNAFRLRTHALRSPNIIPDGIAYATLSYARTCMHADWLTCTHTQTQSAPPPPPPHTPCSFHTRAMRSVDTLSGGSISKVGLFSLGIIPYINASIVLQLLAAAFPALKKLQREEGAQGRARFQYYQKLGAFVFAIVQRACMCTPAWTQCWYRLVGIHGSQVQE
eukprot:1157497-Pelagomonas_calceolata.AAC.9